MKSQFRKNNNFNEIKKNKKINKKKVYETMMLCNSN